MESPMAAEDEVQSSFEPVESRIPGYKDLVIMMNTLCLGALYTFPEDKAGNLIIPGNQFCEGRPNIRIARGKRGTWVVDYVGGIMTVEGKSQRNAIRKLEQHMNPHKDDIGGKTRYEYMVEDLHDDDEDSKYVCCCLMIEFSRVRSLFYYEINILFVAEEVSFKYITKNGSIQLGPAQKVISLIRGFPKLVMKLTGFVANELQNVMSEITVRYRAGDLTMIKEIIINSQKTDPVTMALKEALAMEQSKRQGKRPMEEGAAGSFKIMRVDEAQLVTFHNTLTTEMGNVYKDSLEKEMGKVSNELTCVYKDTLGKEMIKVQNEVKSTLGGMETSFLSAMKTYCAEQLAVYQKYEEKLNEVRAEYETKLEEQRKLHMDEMKQRIDQDQEHMKRQLKMQKANLKAQYKEDLKREVEAELGPLIKVKSVCDKVSGRNSVEKEWLAVGVLAKEMFIDRMKTSPGYATRQYNEGPMVACGYRNRDYWLLQIAAETYYKTRAGPASNTSNNKGKK